LINRPAFANLDTTLSMEPALNVPATRSMILSLKLAPYLSLPSADSMSTGLDAAVSAKEDLSESMEFATVVPSILVITLSLIAVSATTDITL